MARKRCFTWQQPQRLSADVHPLKVPPRIGSTDYAKTSSLDAPAKETICAYERLRVAGGAKLFRTVAEAVLTATMSAERP